MSQLLADLLNIIDNYGIRGIPHKLFHSYLNNRKQYTSINDINSSVLTITNGIPKKSVLSPLLFVVYINDLNNVINHSSMYHFANDTNLLYSNFLLKLISKHINHDLKLKMHWLRANRISLNVDKTNIILFRSKTKKSWEIVELPYKWPENNFYNSYQILAHPSRSTFVMRSWQN